MQDFTEAEWTALGDNQSSIAQNNTVILRNLFLIDGMSVHKKLAFSNGRMYYVNGKLALRQHRLILDSYAVAP